MLLYLSNNTYLSGPIVAIYQRVEFTKLIACLFIYLLIYSSYFLFPATRKLANTLMTIFQGHMIL